MITKNRSNSKIICFPTNFIWSKSGIRWYLFKATWTSLRSTLRSTVCNKCVTYIHVFHFSFRRKMVIKIMSLVLSLWQLIHFWVFVRVNLSAVWATREVNLSSNLSSATDKLRDLERVSCLSPYLYNYGYNFIILS